MYSPKIKKVSSIPSNLTLSSFRLWIRKKFFPSTYEKAEKADLERETFIQKQMEKDWEKEHEQHQKDLESFDRELLPENKKMLAEKCDLSPYFLEKMSEWQIEEYIYEQKRIDFRTKYLNS